MANNESSSKILATKEEISINNSDINFKDIPLINQKLINKSNLNTLNNMNEIIEHVNEGISSKVSLKNHEKNIENVNDNTRDNNPILNEELNEEKYENPYLTKDENFFKQLRESRRMIWIEDGKDPERFDKLNVNNKPKNTLDNYFNRNKNNNIDQNEIEGNFNNSNISFNNDSSKFEIKKSKKFNEMYITKNKGNSYYSNASNYNNLRKMNSMDSTDDIDEGDRKAFFYNNKKPYSSGGYMNNNFAYKRKQKNEFEEEAYEDRDYNRNKKNNYNQINNFYYQNYKNKNRNKFSKRDQSEDSENSFEREKNQNTGFISALDRINTKNNPERNLNKYNNQDFEDPNISMTNANFYNKSNKNLYYKKNKDYEDEIENPGINKNVNNINININTKSINNNIINEDKMDSDNIEDSKIVNLVSKAALGNKFRPPYKKGELYSNLNLNKNKKDLTKNEDLIEKESELDKKLKGYDKKMIELIESEILTSSPDVKWDDIAGLEFAKKTIKEIIIWPMLRPDIFKGIRRPPKGLLLFGPPGTGKTMIAKAIASESKSKFFNISASSLMSKWIGESEKLVRTLFALASFYQPSVIFIDEIDSLLTSRSENECESSRRIKTEFLVQFDGAGTNLDDRILIIGATNRPQEIDDAFLRRMSKRLYIPLPNKKSRKVLIESVIIKETEKNNKYNIQEQDMEDILKITRGYSGSDLMGVCREAAMMPIRNIEDILAVSLENIREVVLNDFYEAVNLIKPSVSEKTINFYVNWNKDFGSFQFEDKDE